MPPPGNAAESSAFMFRFCFPSRLPRMVSVISAMQQWRPDQHSGSTYSYQHTRQWSESLQPSGLRPLPHPPAVRAHFLQPSNGHPQQRSQTQSRDGSRSRTSPTSSTMVSISSTQRPRMIVAPLGVPWASAYSLIGLRCPPPPKPE